MNDDQPLAANGPEGQDIERTYLRSGGLAVLVAAAAIGLAACSGIYSSPQVASLGTSSSSGGNGDGSSTGSGNGNGSSATTGSSSTGLPKGNPPSCWSSGPPACAAMAIPIRPTRPSTATG